MPAPMTTMSLGAATAGSYRHFTLRLNGCELKPTTPCLYPAKIVNAFPANNPRQPMQKLLVANRSEIAIRCFRAATELRLRTVAVYSHEDRFSLHRFKADEAFLIGPPEGGEPVRSYLNIPAIIEVAERYGADAIHPDHGFLPPNPEFAPAGERAG